MRSVRDLIAFEAELTTQRPELGRLAFKRKGRDEYIAMKDVLGFPGTPSQKYQILEATQDEQAQLEANGILITEASDPSPRRIHD